MSRHRHRRSFSPGTAFPSPVEPGEIIVNTSNRQLAVGDADSGSLGAPLALLGVRVFDARAQYAAGDFVVQGGSLYRAKSAVNPGAFNAGQWDVLATDVTLKAYADAGDAAVTTAFQSADAALTTVVNGKVAKAGDTMTGPLVLPVAAPTSDPQAANKKYVDDKIAAIPTPSSLTVSDTPPVGVPDGALWWESDSGLLYVKYNDGNTSQWVIAAPQPDINAFALKADIGAQAVRYDTPQSLTAPQQQQARQNIFAAPFDALAYSGMQLNGGCEIDQAGQGNVAATNNAPYFMDGWVVVCFGAISVLASPDTSFGLPAGFTKYVRLYTTTPAATLAAGDIGALQTRIEGYRTARLAWGTANAQPITLGFWALSTFGVSSTITVSAQNTAANRTYLADVPITNGWTYRTVTIPGCTDGVWNTTNGAGMNVTFCFGGGANSRGTNNIWNAANVAATAQTSNLFATANNQGAITGLIVVPGNEAPSAARSPFIMRPYDQELLACQRYLFVWKPVIAAQRLGIAGIDQATTAQMGLALPVPMRASPTAGCGGLIINGQTVTGCSVYQGWSPAAQNIMSLGFTVGGGLTIGQAAHVYALNGTTSFLTLDARL